MNKASVARRLATYGLLIAVAFLFSYIEALLPLSLGIPGVKLGLANLAVVLTMALLSRREAWAVALVRILLVGFTFGNPYSMLYALCGGVCSVAEVVDWYGKDPYNKKTYTIGLVYALKAGQKWFSESMKTFSYPVFITHGEKDGLVGMDDSVIFFKNAISTDKTLKVYGNLFHEILNEYCKDDVIADMIQWMDARI